MRTVSGNARQLDTPSVITQKIYRKLASTRFTPSYFRYNVTLSRRYRFIWYRVAKVGTRTIYDQLSRHADLDVAHGHLLHYPPAKYENYFKFAFIRNPWDRLVSCWKNKVLENNYFGFEGEHLERMRSFRRFIEFVATQEVGSNERCDSHLCLQSALIDLNQVDFLGRMETMNEDLRAVFDRIGLPMEDMQIRNASKNRKDYCLFYTPELVETVADIYHKDIQIFGYQFD